MEIIIHLFSRKTDSNLRAAIHEYVKRTSPFCRVSVKRYKKASRPVLSKGSHVYVVKPGQNTLSSPELADTINRLCVSGYSCIEFVIEQGLIVDESNNNLFNLSSFHMDNELCAVALSEQIYRAYTILNNITYHK